MPTLTTPLRDRLRSRKLWLGVLGSLLPIATQGVTGAATWTEAVGAAVVVVVTTILSIAHVDAAQAKAVAQIAGDAAEKAAERVVDRRGGSMTGWICPKCDAGVAPTVKRCPCADAAQAAPLPRPVAPQLPPPTSPPARQVEPAHPDLGPPVPWWEGLKYAQPCWPDEPVRLLQWWQAGPFNTTAACFTPPTGPGAP